MRTLIARLTASEAGAHLHDPAPSPLRYRLARLWRRRWVRRLALSQGPALIVAALATALATHPSTHAFVAERAAALRAALDAQPQFAVRRVVVEGVSTDLAAELRAMLDDAVGASSLSLDPAAMRARVEALPRVRRARVALEAPGTLRVSASERAPAALWRIDGRLRLIDAEGVDLGPVARRADRPALPLLLGAGAAGAAAEGLALLAQAAPIAPRVRGLVRVGRRRWDLALDRGVTIRLPGDAPEAALAEALRLHAAADLLARDIHALDLRLPERPTLRLGPAAREALETRRRRDGWPSGSGEDA